MHTLSPELSKTPLTDDQHRFFQQFVSSLSPEQLAWAGGYLTGLVPKGPALSADGTVAADIGGSTDISILVDSQTGNSEALAEQTQQLAASRGLRTVIKKMGDYKLPQLKAEKNLLVIVSTYGEGDPPDNAREIYEYLFNYLRGTLVKSLQDPLTGALAEDDTQLSKYHGIYQQDDRDLRDERRRQKLEPHYQFLVRIRVPGGGCTPTQWLEVDRIANTWCNPTIRLTTRQAYQLHGIVKRNLKLTIAEINGALLDTIAACGDVNRNVMCIPTPINRACTRKSMNMPAASVNI